MSTLADTTRVLENESVRCWLLNFHQSTVTLKETNGHTSVLQLYFITKTGETVASHIAFAPYFFVITAPGMEQDVTLGLTDYFKSKIREISDATKEDLSLPNHLSGIKRTALKLSFQTQNDLVFVRNKLARAIARNSNSSEQQRKSAFYSEKELDMALSETIGSSAYGAHTTKDLLQKKLTSKSTFWSKLVELREHDVPYDVRVCIDWQIFAGSWYDVSVYGGQTTLSPLGKDDSLPLIPPAFRYISFDIETTKLPLKFPQPMTDQIFMISIMYETQSAELLINRDVVSTDIRNFHYFPRQPQKSLDIADGIELGGCVSVRVQNLSNEAQVILAFKNILEKYQPHVVVTYNGDNFDFPFLVARAKVNGISLEEKAEKDNTDDYPLEEDDPEKQVSEKGENKFGFGFLNNVQAHVDCLYWVKRDSYLPIGSHSLKAVTKMKLNYNPVEVDPEEMLPLAKRFPQRMASYSVSDVVATGELFQKYIQPFTFSLCTIIPYAPQKVLRRGSGALCEALLMNQASERNILYPNKIEETSFGDAADAVEKAVQDKSQNAAFEQYKLRFYNGTLIDTETYIGGVVEALESGVFRCDLDVDFNSNASAYGELIDGLDEVLATVIAKELKQEVDWSSEQEKHEQIQKLKQAAENFGDIKSSLITQLNKLRSTQHLREKPNILHLDVGAMYPNIILTNRLQPTSIVSDKTCTSCIYNDPVNRCKRKMDWIWRGTMFTATKAEVTRIIGQLEKESFPYSAIRRYLDLQNEFGDNDMEDMDESNGQGKKGNENQNTQTEPNQSVRNAYRPEKRTYYDRNNDKRGKVPNVVMPKNPSKSEYLFTELHPEVQKALLKKRITEYCKRGHKKLHTSQEVRKTSTVCMRENSFYVDTVRLFRDRRYEYKAQTRQWKKVLESIEAAPLSPDRETKLSDCQQKVVQYESLQTAHKCILNSFYGYVMRTGARWGSIEMAGIVTHLGGQIIQLARELAQSIGVPLELDTDGIWCCLPSSFPLNFVLDISCSGVKKKAAFNYPCAVLNTLVQKKFSNDQYQDVDLSKRVESLPGSTSPSESPPPFKEKHGMHSQNEALALSQHVTHAPAYTTRSTQCCIEFEVDGPHHAMILPASQDEGGSIKKRYAVYYKDFSGGNQGVVNYKLGELKGFELKRRGELKILKDFQEGVFDMFMLGDSLKGSYASAALVASRTLNILINHGYLPENSSTEEGTTYQEIDDEDILEMVTESRTLSKELGEYPTDQKSLALTTAKRLLKLIEMASQAVQDSEWSGKQPVSDYSKHTKGLSCAFVVSKYPIDSPLADRALPTILFSHHVTEVTRKYWLSQWTNISLAALENYRPESFSENSCRFKYLKMVLDWDYYITRFSGCVQKIITIPAALQGMQNPLPLISHPSWLDAKLKKQRALRGTFGSRRQAVLTFQKEANCPEEINGSERDNQKVVSKPPIPPFPLKFSTDLRDNIPVAGNVQQMQKLPAFGAWLLHMSKTWRRRLRDEFQRGRQLSSASKVEEEPRALNPYSAGHVMQIVRISSHEDEIVLDTIVNNSHPLKLTLAITEKIIINVSSPLNLEMYASCVPQEKKYFLSIEPLESDGISLPGNRAVHHLYRVTACRDRRESGWLDRSEIIECFQRNVLPIGVSHGWSPAFTDTVPVNKVSDGGFICGIYPSRNDAVFDTIVSLGNTLRLRPDAQIDLGEFQASSQSTKNRNHQNLLGVFSGSSKTIRITQSDLLPVSDHVSNNASAIDARGYEQVIRSLKQLYVYHVTIESSPSSLARVYAVILIDAQGERGHVYIAYESQHTTEPESATVRLSDVAKKRKLKGKQSLPSSSEKNVQRTIHSGEVTMESIKAFDATIAERISAVHVSMNEFDKWGLPDNFDKVIFSSPLWADAVSEVSQSVDDYIVNFTQKHQSKALVIVQSANVSDNQTSETNQSDVWKNLSLPRAASTVPILYIPMNTSDENLSGARFDAATEIQAIISRCVHRYFFAASNISYYLAFSQYGRIPLCNLHGSDGRSPNALFWDVTYARQLAAKGHIWVQRDQSPYTSALYPKSNILKESGVMNTQNPHDVAQETCTPKKMEETQYGVQIDGIHIMKRENTMLSSQFAATWSVEFFLENIDIAAMLMSSSEQNDREQRQFFNREDTGDIDLKNRLRVLQWTVESVYSKKTIEGGIDVQESLLQTLPRWIRADPVFETLFEDPGVQAMYMHSLRKTMAILLLYFKKRIGGRVIFANTSRIIIGTDKRSIDECFAFAKHAIAMCSESATDSTIATLFRYAKLRMTSFWCPLLFVSEKNFIGRRVDVDTLTSALNVQNSSIEYQWESSEIFPHAQQRKMFVAHLFYFMVLSSNLVDASLKMSRENAENPSARGVSLHFVLSGIYKYLQTSFQQQLLKQLDLFTHIGGDVCKYAGLFLRYLCIILQTTKTIEDSCVQSVDDVVMTIPEIMESVYQNACRILDSKILTSDSQNALLQPSGSKKLYSEFSYMLQTNIPIGRIAYVLPFTILRDFTCPFCYSLQNVYLLNSAEKESKEESPDTDMEIESFSESSRDVQRPSMLQCLYCTFVFDEKQIECTLIDSINREVNEYFAQDIICTECGVCKETLLARQCTACVHGEIQCKDRPEGYSMQRGSQVEGCRRNGKHRNQSISFGTVREGLLGRKIIAKFRNFELLQEIVDGYSGMFFD